ncbi:MAG: tetratricopeptide repeat protein, partial [Kiritimatiellia bacterium]|nr:tetratricopeptide repeat protein [Kiritimatiellia bacterium]
RAFAETWPDHPEANLNRIDWAAALFLMKDRSDDAEKQLRLAEQDENDPHIQYLARLRLAEWYSSVGRIPEARAILRRLMDSEQTAARDRGAACLAMAALLEAQNENDAALIALERSDAWDLPDESRHRIRLAQGRILLKTGSIEKGRLLIRETIRLAPALPESADTFLFVARYLANQQQWESAWKKYSQYLETFPQHPGTRQVLIERARCLVPLNRFSEAAAEYERLIEQAADDPVLRFVALRGAADTRFSNQEPDAARKLYQRLMEESPDSRTVLEAEFQIAETFRAGGRFADAELAFQRFIERHPESPDTEQARLHLALIAEQTQQWTVALNRYDTL